MEEYSFDVAEGKLSEKGKDPSRCGGLGGGGKLSGRGYKKIKRV